MKCFILRRLCAIIILIFCGLLSAERDIMVNEEKVKIMSRMAMFEDKIGKQNIEIAGYYKNDYIKSNSIKTVLASTVEFAAIIFLWVLGGPTSFFAVTGKLGMALSIVVGILVYAGFVFAHVQISRRVNHNRFDKVQNEVKQYKKDLKELETMFYKG